MKKKTAIKLKVSIFNPDGVIEEGVVLDFDMEKEDQATALRWVMHFLMDLQIGLCITEKDYEALKKRFKSLNKLTDGS